MAIAFSENDKSKVKIEAVKSIFKGVYPMKVHSNVNYITDKGVEATETISAETDELVIFEYPFEDKDKTLVFVNFWGEFSVPTKPSPYYTNTIFAEQSEINQLQISFYNPYAQKGYFEIQIVEFY